MLFYIKLNNFKTYKGEKVIGPIRSLSVLIGSNGSGKSNLTDAIAFAMGVRLELLRVNAMVNLIHGGNIGKPASDCASVTAVFRLEDGSEKHFTRNILLQLHLSSATPSATSTYTIDDEEVSMNTYLAELQTLGVCITFENYFLFQGNIETFVRMKPKDYTSLIEELSGSGALKEEYDVLYERICKQEKHIEELCSKRKTFLRASNAKKKEMVAYLEYCSSVTELEKLEKCEKLLLLYDNEREIKKCEDEYNKIQIDIQTLEKQKTRAEPQISDKELEKLNLYISKTTEILKKEDNEFQKRSQIEKRVEGDLELLMQKIKLVTDSIERKKKLEAKDRQVIQELENDLNDVRTTEAEYEKSIQSHEMDISLQEEMVKEYDELTQKSEMKTSSLRKRLFLAETRLTQAQQLLDIELNKKTQVKKHQQGITNEIDGINLKFKEIDNSIRQKKISIQEKKKLQEEIHSVNEEIEKVKKDLEIVVKHLMDINRGNELFLKQRKKLALVQDLKSAFGNNVLGRLSDICRPVHERYKLAVTKVMGRNLDAFVVKNKYTAVEIIKYLKTFEIPPEIILPLDHIKVYPIQEKLRNLTPQGIKLIYDVIDCQHPEAQSAIQFAVSNTLVCDNSDQARYVAYRMNPSEKYDVVTLDGTYYSRHGTASSGRASLEDKAKHWMEKDILQAENRKMQLREKLRNLEKTSGTKKSMQQISDEISSLETNIKDAIYDQKKWLKKLEDMQSKQETLETQYKDIDVVVAGYQQQLSVHQKDMQKIEGDINLLKDTIFANFCNKIGVTNIREYEGISLRSYRDRMEKENEFTTHKQNILAQLEYENERISGNYIEKQEEELRKLRDELEAAKFTLEKTKEDVQTSASKIKDIKIKLQTFKTELFSAKARMIQRKEHIKTIEEDISEGTLQLKNMRLKIEQLHSIRGDILLQSQVELNIPALTGILQGNDELSTQFGRDARPPIDYRELPNNLKYASNVEEKLKELRYEIEDLKFKIRNESHNVKVTDEYYAIQLSQKQVAAEISSALKLMKQNKVLLKPIKDSRYNKFMSCFTFLETAVDNTYKELYDSQSGTAFLVLENMQEPYHEGVQFCVQVPDKRCIMMDCLSAGEAAMASLTFLFALNRYRKAPIIILDEPDQSLDRRNMLRFAKFVKHISQHVQTIITTQYSHRAYSMTEDIIGVVKSTEDDLPVSEVYILDLTRYQTSSQVD